MYHRRRARPPGPARHGAGWRRGPNALARPPARPHAGTPHASSAGTRPQPGPGGFGHQGASPHASEERASGRACAVLAWPDRVPASFWFTRSERRRLHASSRGAPLSTVRLRTATRTKACDPSATASALPLGQPTPQKDTSRLRGGHRSPHIPWPVSTRRHTGARIRKPHGQPPARAWLRRRAELAPWPPPEALPPCALRADPTRLPHTICSGTMSACENGGPPPLPFSGGEERPPPLQKWVGRREAAGRSKRDPPVAGGLAPFSHYF